MDMIHLQFLAIEKQRPAFGFFDLGLREDIALAGQVGVAGHLTIGDGVIATAQTGIPGSVEKGSVILRIDERARVLDADGLPVPDLLAAGADAGCIFTGGYGSGLAAALVYLASPHAAFTNGTVLTVDGAMTAAI